MRNLQKGGGIFRRNKSLVFILVDVVFLVIIFIVVMMVTRLRGDAELLPGIGVKARAVVYGDQVLISVTLKSLNEGEANRPLRINLGYPGGGPRVELSDFLPQGEGQTNVIRGALRYIADRRMVKIDLVTAEKSTSMTAKIKQE